MTLFQLIYILGVLFNILGYVRKQDPIEVQEKAFIDKYGEEFGCKVLNDFKPYKIENPFLKWVYRIIFIIGSFFSWIVWFVFLIYLGIKFNWFKDNPHLHK